MPQEIELRLATFYDAFQIATISRDLIIGEQVIGVLLRLGAA
jgi:hypothetical protein